MKTQAEMEAIMNLTYPGLQLIYRDANLRIAGAKYEPGMLLREPGFTDASSKGGGILTTHRYAILSNRFRDMAQREQGTDWGLCVIERGAHFKVLDVHRARGKASITLLHLPEEHWRFFDEVSTNVDDLLVDYARDRFERSLDMEPIPEINTREWRNRCCFPIGMSDLGVPYPLAGDDE